MYKQNGITKKKCETMKLLNHPDLEPKHQVEINYDSHRSYRTNDQIKFKTIMLRSSLCDYSDACILIKGTITITRAT